MAGREYDVAALQQYLAACKENAEAQQEEDEDDDIWGEFGSSSHEQQQQQSDEGRCTGKQEVQCKQQEQEKQHGQVGSLWSLGWMPQGTAEQPLAFTSTVECLLKLQEVLCSPVSQQGAACSTSPATALPAAAGGGGGHGGDDHGGDLAEQFCQHVVAQVTSQLEGVTQSKAGEAVGLLGGLAGAAAACAAVGQVRLAVKGPGSLQELVQEWLAAANVVRAVVSSSTSDAACDPERLPVLPLVLAVLGLLPGVDPGGGLHDSVRFPAVETNLDGWQDATMSLRRVCMDALSVAKEGMDCAEAAAAALLLHVTKPLQ
jgi:hypothetical protein